MRNAMIKAMKEMNWDNVDDIIKESLDIKDKILVKLLFGDRVYTVRASSHARQRMIDRNIEELVVVGNILALGEERLNELYKLQEEAVIIDEDKGVAIVVKFRLNMLTIITVIDTKYIYNNKGVRIINI